MANIRKLYEADQTTQLMPQTHVKAVVDNDGNTVESMMGALSDYIRDQQMEIGAATSEFVYDVIDNQVLSTLSYSASNVTNVKGKWINDDGVVGSETNTTLWKFDYISTKEGEEVYYYATRSGVAGPSLILADSSDNVLWTSDNTTQTFTVPTNGARLYFNAIQSSFACTIKKKLNREISDLYSLAENPSKYVDKINIPQNYVGKYALDGTGGYVSDNDGQIYRFPVTEGDWLYLRLSKDKAGVYQFQGSNVIGSNVIGNCVTEAVDGYVRAPKGATWLVISVTNNSTNFIVKKTVYSQSERYDINNGVVTQIANGSLGNSGNANAIRTNVVRLCGAEAFSVFISRPNTEGYHYEICYMLISSKDMCGSLYGSTTTGYPGYITHSSTYKRIDYP